VGARAWIDPQSPDPLKTRVVCTRTVSLQGYTRRITNPIRIALRPLVNNYLGRRGWPGTSAAIKEKIGSASGQRRLAHTLRGDLETMAMGWDGKTEEDLRDQVSSPGIVVTDSQGRIPDAIDHPRIAAFIWGGKAPPPPTLPYGRWKGAA